MNIRLAFFVMVGVLMMGVRVRADVNGWVVSLERGYKGIVPCPSISYHHTATEEWENVYWYFSGMEPENLLISYHYDQGQEVIPEGVYGIDGACSLVIENVVDSNRGSYYFQLEPRNGAIQEGLVVVKVYGEEQTVFLERGSRGTLPCLPIQKHQITKETSDAIYWYFPDFQAQHLLISYFLGSVAPQNGIPEGMYDIDDELSLVIENLKDEDAGKYFFKLLPMYGMSIMAGDVTVKVFEGGLVVFLELGHRGIVPCPPITSNEVTEKETDAAYWYFPQMQSEFLLISYFLGKVAAQNGIPENVYDINEEMSLVIENVTESDAGEYFFKMNSRFGRVSVKVYDLGLRVALERGRRGIVLCPPIASHDITVENTDAVYWYYRRMESTFLLASYIQGEVSTQNGVTTSVYDIDTELSLVIANVTDSDEGDYFFILKPGHGPIKEGKITITVKVSPRELFPRVLQCDTRTECKLEIPLNDPKPHYLTCIVENAKPPVKLTWWRLMENDSLERHDADERVKHNVHQPDKTARIDVFPNSNTFTTTLFLRLSSTTTENDRYRCEANGVALEDRNKNHVTVVVTTKHPTYNPAVTCTCRKPLMIGLAIVAASVTVVLILLLRYVARRTSGNDEENIPLLPKDRLFDNDLTLKNRGECRDFYNHLRMISSHKVSPSRLDILTINVDDIKDNGDLFQGILELVVPTHIVYYISFPENVEQVLVVLNNVIGTLGLNYRTQYSLIRVGKGRPRQVNDYDQCLTNLKYFFQTQFKNGHRFGMTVECDIVDSRLTTLVDILTTNEAFEFDVLHQSMNGHLKCLKYLIPSLKILHLIDCALTSHDLNDLAEFISSAKQLSGLFISGGKFDKESINSLLARLWHCPNIMCLLLSNTGLEPSFIRSAVRANFGVKEDESGASYNGLFCIKQKKKSDHVYPHFQLHKLPEKMA